ncbi:DNA repair protein XRCC3-like protein [Pyrus ussuriensis x Pyrus communis]|uniref:DNA repair protein XRCC3-like protein n=1 Tax=Pyrus ussuriensis x Pyrus communis TaxID=2448454 RepID=A0A5N5I0C1_9ROSA|nr:DNA repair protein XRCC3-like protein [Pyrus ussuriensis x Pyrus communis]
MEMVGHGDPNDQHYRNVDVGDGDDGLGKNASVINLDSVYEYFMVLCLWLAKLQLKLNYQKYSPWENCNLEKLDVRYCNFIWAMCTSSLTFLCCSYPYGC